MNFFFRFSSNEFQTEQKVRLYRWLHKQTGHHRSFGHDAGHRLSADRFGDRRDWLLQAVHSDLSHPVSPDHRLKSKD